MTEKYEIKDWEKHQHYKDGRPMQWIKVQVSLLDNFAFDDLAEMDQLNLLKLWLFAAKNGGKFEGSEKFLARKIGAEKLNINNLLQSGFVVRTNPYEKILREEEKRREEKRSEKKRREKIRGEDKAPLSGEPDDEAGGDGKKNNFKESAAEVIDYLNEKRRSNYKPVPSNLSLIIARLKEGHTQKELTDVIDMKTKDWKDKPSMKGYIRPATLFNAEKFNQYVGELPAYHREKNGELDWLHDDFGVSNSTVIEGVFARG